MCVFFSVVNQMYDIQIHDEYVIMGNTGILKCHIPTFVKEYVKVTSWFRQDESGSIEKLNSGMYKMYSNVAVVCREF